MLKFPKNKFYNSYIIESNNLDKALYSIMKFLKENNFNVKMIEGNSNPDVHIIKRDDDKQSINIDVIRKRIINDVDTKPIIEKRKIYIVLIDTYLSNDIQNTLLKTLEDAPSFVSIFLVIKNREMLLDTVRSRCFYIRDDDDSFIFDKTIDINIYEDFIDLISNLKYRNLYDIIKTSKTIKGLSNDQYKNLCGYILNLIRDAFYYKKTSDKKIFCLKDKENQIISISETFTYTALNKMVDRFIEACDEIGNNIDKSLITEDIFFDIKSYIK